jgi:hypothetical protein
MPNYTVTIVASAGISLMVFTGDMSTSAVARSDWSIAPNSNYQQLQILTSTSLSDNLIIDVHAARRLLYFVTWMAERAKYPAILIRSFGRGLILSAMGALSGIGFLVLRPYYLAVIGSILFMVGSILIAQALLQGEEIDQKT